VFQRVGVAPNEDIASAEAHDKIAQDLALCSATSFLGVPALALPTGLAAGRPLGVQLIAGAWREDRLWAAGAVLEGALGRLGPAPQA